MPLRRGRGEIGAASKQQKSRPAILDLADARGYFSVYLSSAGSGKTFTLTRNYVKWALSAPAKERRFAQIIAITFTNKATEEMRARILEYVDALAQGRGSEMGPRRSG